MYKSGNRKVLSLILCAALTLGVYTPAMTKKVKAEGQAPVTATGPAVTPVNPADIKLNKTKGIFMAGKKVPLVISGTTNPVTWTLSLIHI